MGLTLGRRFSGQVENVGVLVNEKIGAVCDVSAESLGEEVINAALSTFTRLSKAASGEKEGR